MTRSRELVELVEAAYALELPHDEWLGALTALIEKWWGQVVSFSFDTRGSFELSMFESVDLELEAAVHGAGRAMIERAGAGPDDAAELRPIEPAAEPNASSDIAVFLVPETFLAKLSRGVGSAPPAHRRGVCFALAARAMTGPETQRWRHFVYHLTRAFRLRTAVDRSSRTRDGAEDGGATADARELLRSAVLYAHHQAEALTREVWDGLVTGRLSLADHLDAEGRQSAGAHLDVDEVTDPRALTPLEIDVARQLARGLPDKLIGDALNLSTAAVVEHVASIARKVRAGSRGELVRFLELSILA